MFKGLAVSTYNVVVVVAVVVVLVVDVVVDVVDVVEVVFVDVDGVVVFAVAASIVAPGEGDMCPASFR